MLEVRVSRSYIEWPATDATVQRWSGWYGVILMSSCEIVPITVSLPMNGSATSDAHSIILPM